MRFKLCESDFYFLKGSKNCRVATYNFRSVYWPAKKKIVLIAYAQKLLQTPTLMLARGLNVGLRHHVRAYFVYATS